MKLTNFEIASLRHTEMKTTNNLLTVHIFFHLKNHPVFLSEQKVGQISKKKSVLCKL